MSGIEVAGIVLAVLSLVISALEDYKRGLKPLKRLALTWRLELQNLTRCLREQKYFFRINLRRLVIAAAPDSDDYKVSEDLVSVLKHGSARESIERYLVDGESVEMFDGILKDYVSLLGDIVQKLKHIHRPTEDTNDLEEIVKANPAVDGKFALRKRFNFTMQSEAMNTLTDSLEKCNSRFRDFVEGIDGMHRLKLKNPSKTEDAKRLAASLSAFRQHATSVYEALSSGWGFCRSSHEHEAMLMLECREALDSGSNTAMPASVASFRMVLSTGPANGASRSFCETSITVAHTEKSGTKTTIQEVLDLCQRLSAKRDAGAALLMDLTIEKRLLCDENANCRACLGLLYTCDIISLDEYLVRGNALSIKQRTILALNLASSVLQLHATEWLEESWTKKAIRFFQTRNLNTTVDSPFILRRFPRSVRSTGSTIESDVLELGVLLLEIWEQRTFESWAMKESSNISSEYYARMAMALRWLKSATDSMTPSYADAVSVCVRFSFEGVQHDWENPNFRRAFCEKVIASLQENCKSWIPPS